VEIKKTTLKALKSLNLFSTKSSTFRRKKMWKMWKMAHSDADFSLKFRIILK